MRVEFEGNNFEFPDDTPEEQLPGLLEAAKPASWWDAISAIPKTTVGLLRQSVGGMTQALAEQEIDPFRRELFSSIGIDPNKLQDWRAEISKPVAAAGAGIAEIGKETVEEATPANLTFWKRALLQGGSSALSQVPTLALSIAGGSPTPALIGAAAIAGGESYAEKRKAGLPSVRALGHAAFDAEVEAAMELLPMQFIVDNFGGPVLKLIAGTLIREVPTEVATTAINQANAKLSDRPDMSWEEYAQGLLDTAGSTLISAPLLAGTAKAMSPLGRSGTITEDYPPQQQPPQAPPVEPPPPPFDQPTTELTVDQQARVQAIVDHLNTVTITDQDVTAATEHIRKLDEARKNLAPERIAVAWSELVEAPTDKVDASELGASERQAANAPNYVNPNTGDRLQRTFSFGPEDAIGKTPSQVLPAKSTYVLGEATEDRPDFYLKALQETVEQWRQKFLPDSTIVLSNEQIYTDSALGWHYTTRPGFHMIVPAVLRNPSKGLGAFNVNTQVSAFYNATHEFGHALVKDRLLAGIDPLVAKLIWQESELGTISDQALAAVSNEKVRALLQYFNELKARVLSNEMSAQEYLDVWSGPAKAARKTFLKDLDVAPTDNAMAVAKAMARRARLKSNIRTEVKQRELERQLLGEFFGLEEFLAEQLSRHAYAKRWEAKTPLGKLFGDVFIGLRQTLASFFKHLKATGGIRAGTEFQEWLDDLSRADRPLTRAEKIAKGKAKGPAKVVTEKPIEKKPAPRAKKVARVQHNTETETDSVKADTARKLVANLVREKILTPQDADFKAMLQQIKLKDWDEFTDLLQRYAVKKVKFELDDTPENHRPILERMQAGYGNLRNQLTEGQALEPSVLADAAQEWKEKGFRSKYFKAWFGDWETEARTGASQVQTHTGEPLPVYHLSWHGRPLGKGGRISFTEFAKGDIGFHFGTVRAANNRGLRGAALVGFDLPLMLQMYEQQAPDLIRSDVFTPVENSYIIPAALNLRNPLDLGVERTSSWGFPPRNMVEDLVRRGIFTRDEGLAISAETDIALEEAATSAEGPEERILFQYEASEPIRRALLRKGFDGLTYINLVEGGRSWVAFYPEQVKSLLGHATFSRSKNMHLELDFDKSAPEGEGASRMYRSLKNFHPDPVGWKKSLRKMQELSFKVLQIQQLAHLNPDVVGLVDFNTFNTYYNLRKNKLQAPADHITQRWQGLGKENLSKINRFLIEEMEGGVNWFEPVNPTPDQSGQPLYWNSWQMGQRAVEELRKRGIDIETEQGKELAGMILEVKNDLLFRLNEMQKTLSFLLASRYAGGSDADVEAAIKPLVRHMQQIRNSPFFPQGRFGRYMLTVEKKRSDAPGYEVVWKEAFESREKRDEAWKTADAKKQGDERIRAHELGDQSYVMLGLPTDFVDLAASELDLSEEQVDLLLNILQPVRREKALKTYDQARLGIKGYTADALRSYGNFAWHDSNLIAKLEYRSKFNSALRKVKADLRVVQYGPPNPYEEWRLEQIHKAMESTRDYIMAPPYELQGLRAFLSVAYLGLNIKTALINFYGLVTNWADVTTELGLATGTASMLKHTAQMFKTLQLTNLNERRAGDYLEPDAQQALDRALEEGVLSQSYAYHLAGIANQGNLNRMIPGYNLSSRITKRAVDVAMWPFRLTELSSRRVTFLSQYDLAKRKGNSDPYAEAVRKTNLLQNDYSTGNRVPFMRGGFAGLGPVAPLATVFMSFAQHMAFNSYGGYELGERRSARLAGMTPRTAWGGYTMKVWIITLLVAGYEGLPGAENILDLLELMWRKFGGQKPLRQALREYVQATDVGLDPMLAARGLGHNIGGFDISRSIGFGRFVPGTDVLAHPGDNPAEQVGTLTLDMLGVAGSVVKFGLEATLDPKPLSESAQRMPGGIGNLYTAYYWSENGVRAPTGALITRDLETDQIRDLTDLEIWGKALGFNPTIVSQNREIRFQQYDRKIYWQTRRDMLMDDVWRAKWQRDREAEADARKAVTDFNASVPRDYSDLRIRPIDIHRSIQARDRVKRLEESQLPPQKRYRQLYRDVRESFERP